MMSTSPCEHPGNRLRTMELLDASIMSQYSSPFHLSLKSITDFVPYTYKDIKDVDLIEYSALRHFGMLPYITSMGRHCVPQLLPYKPTDFLPETVEYDVSEELGSGKDSQEVIYYREAAPYGPTYYLMMLIAEVFWSNFRGNRFLMSMVYSYLPALHGNPYNWAKAILKSLSLEITFLQNEARAAVKHTRKNVQGDISPAELADKFHVPITNLHLIREHCTFKEIDDLPQADLAMEVGKASTKMKEKKGEQEKAVHTSSSNSDDEGMPLAKQRRTSNEQRPKVRVVTRETPTVASRVATVQPVPSLPHMLSAHAAQLQEQIDRLNDEISSLMFSLERAEKQQALARKELVQARIQLRCLQKQRADGWP
ncbi:hypothetical protein R1sor_014735 [Riccia sorocarpa]|uniref:Uncharacterized protein n=1 Tax=Riccia sorocarpa TaxID=122646 RepID=A0ABD3HC37_9MARC